MSRIRHEMRKPRKAKPGAVYSGAGSNVVQEAVEKRRGGPVKEVEKPEGKRSKRRLDKRARVGGAGKVLTGAPADREMAQMEREADTRPRKANGGYIGTDRQPFSSAAAVVGGDDPNDLGRHRG